MSYTNQYFPTVFPYHRDGVFTEDPTNDQSANPENFSSRPEDQYFLPQVPGRTYRIRYTDPYASLYPPKNGVFGVGRLRVWHDPTHWREYIRTDFPADVGVLDPGFLHYWELVVDWTSGTIRSDQIIIDANLYPAFSFPVGGFDEIGDNTLHDGDTRLSVIKLNGISFTGPAYSIDISIGGGPAARYRAM